MARTVEPMTSGTIWKRMVFFAFPLFLGNLFQQLYNTVDSLIVGNFLGSSALAAVSSSGSLIFMLIGFLSGIAGGAGVVIARLYGAGDTAAVQRAVHTTAAFGLVAGAGMTVLGVMSGVPVGTALGRRLDYAQATGVDNFSEALKLLVSGQMSKEEKEKLR